jgi:hypothetical protein
VSSKSHVELEAARRVVGLWLYSDRHAGDVLLQVALESGNFNIATSSVISRLRLIETVCALNSNAAYSSRQTPSFTISSVPSNENPT